MFKPLMLGGKSFPTNLIQGPLAGLSSAPFRKLVSRYSQPAYTCTEMISCKTLIHQAPRDRERLVKKDKEEGLLCFQLAASEPKELGEAVQRVEGLGADLVDLNGGCPVKKIRKKGAGSGLLSDAGKLYQLIRAMKDNTTLPVSVKIRVEGGGETFNEEIAKAVSDAGADFLIVHGRHWTEHYETPCRHEAIAYFVQQVKIPVIGNGDVSCLASLQKMLATGCAGVMVGRASVGRPWLIGNLLAEAEGREGWLPSLREVGEIFWEHVLDLTALLGNECFAILQARKFAKYYGRPLEERAAFCEAMNRCETLSDLKPLCEHYFGVGGL